MEEVPSPLEMDVLTGMAGTYASGRETVNARKSQIYVISSRRRSTMVVVWMF
jgi:hypothetical protein